MLLGGAARSEQVLGLRGHRMQVRKSTGLGLAGLHLHTCNASMRSLTLLIVV